MDETKGLVSKGAFHLSELTGQTIPVVMRILLLIKTIQPDPSNPKYYGRRRWFFNTNCWEKPISLLKYCSSHGLGGQF